MENDGRPGDGAAVLQNDTRRSAPRPAMGLERGFPAGRKFIAASFAPPKAGDVELLAAARRLRYVSTVPPAANRSSAGNNGFLTGLRHIRVTTGSRHEDG